LNYYQNETTYHFEGLTTTYDLQSRATMAKTQFVSEDCGERFVLSDLVVSAPAFDSLRVMASYSETRAGKQVHTSTSTAARTPAGLS
jgi:hypothetical protein